MYAQLEGRAGNSRQAIKLCNQGLEQFPNNVHLLCTLGQIHESVGESDEAKNAWAKALQVCPSCAVAAYELGSLAWKQGDIESAKKHFSIGIKSRGKNLNLLTHFHYFCMFTYSDVCLQIGRVL
jgi:Flp pilus assembly protein TadD